MANDRDSLFHASPISIIIVDTDGKIIEANTITTALSGYSLVELLGSNIKSLFHPKDVPFLEHTLSTLRSKGNVSGVTMTIRLTTKQGSFIWVRLSFATSNGDIVILFVNPEDVMPTAGASVVVRAHSTLNAFLRENWKGLLGILSVIGTGLIKLILVLNEVMEKLQITWK